MTTRLFYTEADYLQALEADGQRWDRPTPGSYADLYQARLLPRGF